MTSPLILLVCSAVLAGVVGSLFLIIALSVDTWETVTFNSNTLLKFNVSAEYSVTLATSSTSFSVLERTVNVVVNGSAVPQTTKYFLYESYSGVWRICDILSDSARQRLEALKAVTVNECYTFVSEYDEETSNLPDWMQSIGRMQNSAASCFIVSMIDLAAAAAVGTFAIAQKQVSACMVTGVLYCMAGLFSIFGLTIFHTKMYYERYQCYSFDELMLPPAACEARSVEVGWAMPFAWVGVVFAILAFGLWIFVTRAFRLIKSKTMI